MGESSGSWGYLAEHDPEFAEFWDGYERLPEPGQNDVLDGFCRRKHLSIASLIRVGARLSDYRVLAFAGPGYIKYRNMETDERSTMPGSALNELRMVPSQTGDSDTVIVAEGETDAARLTMLYPQANVGILPGGARRLTQTMVEQVVGYPVVLATYDQGDGDGAGDKGWVKFKAHVPHAVRWNPRGCHDWCDFEGEAPDLPLPVEVDRVGPIIFRSLAEVVAGGVPDPEVLVDDLLYTEGLHLVSGHPGCGKSTIVMWMAELVLMEGGHVVMLDYESGEAQTARRIQALDIPPKTLENLHYAGWPTDAEKHMAEIGQKWPGALVVIDSLSKALSSAGLNENDNSEVTTWTTKVVRACKENQMPIIVIDHVTKVGDSDYSRGAGAKLADVDVHWRVKKEEDFNRTQQGKISLHQKKDREGYFPFSLYYRVGDGNGGLPIQAIDGDDDDDTDDSNEPAI